MFEEKAVQSAILNKVQRRCYSCIHFQQLFNGYTKPKLKFKPEFMDQFFNKCKFGAPGEIGMILSDSKRNSLAPISYEMRHNNNSNGSPWNYSANLAPDSTHLFASDAFSFNVNARTPRCSNFIYRFVEKLDAKFTQLGLGGYLNNINTYTKEESTAISNKIIRSIWSLMFKDNNKWRPITLKDKITTTNKLRNKYTITEFLPNILNKIVAEPIIVKPFRPATNICWPLFHNEIKLFYKEWSRRGDNFIYKEYSNALLELYAPEYTEEYLTTGQYKGKVKMGEEWLTVEEAKELSEKIDPDFIKGEVNRIYEENEINELYNDEIIEEEESYN